MLEKVKELVEDDKTSSFPGNNLDAKDSLVESIRIEKYTQISKNGDLIVLATALVTSSNISVN